MKYLINFLSKNQWSIFTLLIAAEISIVAGYYFIFIAQEQFVFFDASARLNIARRIFDSLTPGLGQVGSVWPPFPQILMSPFVAFDYLWKSGIAGWIISGISYILSSFFIFKSVVTLTKKHWAGFIASLAFLLNINAIYLQTTAMSEAFFWLTLSANFYFLSSYVQTKDYKYLVPAALAMCLSVLTRYESYALLAGSALVILFANLIWKNSWKNIRGALFLYLVPASFGVFLWSTYLWLIFGDPLYWLHFYAGEPDKSVEIVEKVRPTLLEAINVYTTAVANMNGLFTTFFGLLAFVFVAVSRKIKGEAKTLLLLPLFLLIFMLLSLSRNTPIIQPPITIDGILDKSINNMDEFNIRYGLNFLPYFAIFIGVLIARIRFIILPFIWFTAIQTIAYFWTPYYLTYQLHKGPINFATPGIPWLQANYDDGLILVSSQAHDPDIRALGLPHKTYIYEGSQDYWTKSLQNPSKFAKWMVFSRNNPDDRLAKRFQNEDLTKYGFQLVHIYHGTEVYKRIDK